MRHMFSLSSYNLIFKYKVIFSDLKLSDVKPSDLQLPKYASPFSKKYLCNSSGDKKHIDQRTNFITMR